MHGSLVHKNVWYRKTFRLSLNGREKYIVIHFESVCSICEVCANEIPVGHNFIVGVGFDINIMDMAHYGENVNVVAVDIDNSEYEGCSLWDTILMNEVGSNTYHRLLSVVHAYDPTRLTTGAESCWSDRKVW